MGAALKLDYTYRYTQPSMMTSHGAERGLHLATFGGSSAAPGAGILTE